MLWLFKLNDTTLDGAPQISPFIMNLFYTLVSKLA